MRISKMYLKQSFSYCKWVLQAILSLTVLSNSSIFDTVFQDYWIGNLMRILKFLNFSAAKNRIVKF